MLPGQCLTDAVSTVISHVIDSMHACVRAGYTPLHMAVGYSHVATVGALLEAGADPEVQDRQSRDVVALVQSIRDQMPVSPQFMGRRMALEQVTALLSGERGGVPRECPERAQ